MSKRWTLVAVAAVGVVEPWRAGMASGINSTFRQVGISTRIAAWGAICAGVLAAIGAILCFVLIRPQDFLAHGRQ